MRVKVGVLATVLAAAAIAAAPSAASAARLTINAQPNPITAGDSVVVFGRLKVPGKSGQTITLWHRLPAQSAFTPVQQTQTDASGRYQFTRLPGVVDTNRAWYVTALAYRSRTVRERVAALVTLSGPPAGSTLLTGPAHPYTFTGTVSPAKPGARVLLQRQDAAGSGDHWGTIQRGVVAVGGTFSFTHVFSVPGDANIRVLVQADQRNIASPSAPVEYQIQQAQNPALTITGAPLPLPYGQAETISGVAKNAAGMPVTLFAATDNSRYVRVAQVNAGSDGSYSFTQAPVNSTFYRVSAGGRSSSRLFVGVKDQLTIATVSNTTIPEGGAVTITGSVAPDKTGHVIYLQRQNATGGGFHTIQVDRVGAGSAFTITRVFTEAGTKVVRVLIPGGPENIGAASAPITVTVTPATITAPSS